MTLESKSDWRADWRWCRCSADSGLAPPQLNGRCTVSDRVRLQRSGGASYSMTRHLELYISNENIDLIAG